LSSLFSVTHDRNRTSMEFPGKGRPFRIWRVAPGEIFGSFPFLYRRPESFFRRLLFPLPPCQSFDPALQATSPPLFSRAESLVAREGPCVLILIPPLPGFPFLNGNLLLFHFGLFWFPFNGIDHWRQHGGGWENLKC